MLRAAAPHYLRVRKLLQHVYEAIRLHRFIDGIDVALCNGDFEQLCLLLGISNYMYAKFLGPSNDSADHYSPESSGEAQAVLYQQPNLPDVEVYLHVQYVEVIRKLEKKMADDPEFPCCSCERLMQRKQVMAFKFSDMKFSSNMWRTLKDYISKGNSSAVNDTHYVCSYCQVQLNDEYMPSGCVLNGLMVEPVPPELESLDPLGKQIIQWAKAFQAVYMLGTYTGKVPSHTSVKACKGTMFFLPLPLDKTMDMLEEIEGLAKVNLLCCPIQNCT